eukprot:TRINITY_DN5142_c1_g1_i1.p1 TRINITY_DN5142_c1_g1~~TRINITY_DN5142_c1_g1_i1.p1  ORF type:complete len:368 (-),score=56.99 TRINITY_DN5142_c1_g1_i1:188-1174(-)
MVDNLVDKNCQEEFAHSGMLEAAQTIVQDLVKSKVLDNLLFGNEEAKSDQDINVGKSAQQQEMPTSIKTRRMSSLATVARNLFNAKLFSSSNRRIDYDCSGWDIVVTGHSLGAGTAAIVAWLLRQRYENVKCWSFSPPAGTLSSKVAKEMEAYCHSVCIGKDMIPRLSFHTFEKLRDEAVAGLFLCKWNKQQLFWDSILRCCCCSKSSEFLYKFDEVPSEVMEGLQKFQNSVEQAREVDQFIAKSREFVPPGKLIFFRALSQQDGKKSRVEQFDVVWITADELLNEGILVSPRMFLDHFPDQSTEIIQRTAQRLRKLNNGPELVASLV